MEARQVHDARGTAQLIREDLVQDTASLRVLSIITATRDRVTSVLYRARATTTAPAAAILITLAPGRPATGFVSNGSGAMEPLTPERLEQPFLATDLLIGDLTDDFLAWPSQQWVGNEKLLGHDCAIVESRPATNARTASARVRSWIARSMALPLKVEKYDAAGALQRRFIVERVSRLDDRHWGAAVLTVTGAGERTRTTLKMRRGDRHAEVKVREFEVATIRQFLVSKPAATAPKARSPQ